MAVTQRTAEEIALEFACEVLSGDRVRHTRNCQGRCKPFTLQQITTLTNAIQHTKLVAESGSYNRGYDDGISSAVLAQTDLPWENDATEEKWMRRIGGLKVNHVTQMMQLQYKREWVPVTNGSGVRSWFCFNERTREYHYDSAENLVHYTHAGAIKKCQQLNEEVGK